MSVKGCGFRVLGVLNLFLGQIRGDPLKETLLNPTYGSLSKGTLLRGSISPRVPLILHPKTLKPQSPKTLNP